MRKSVVQESMEMFGLCGVEVIDLTLDDLVVVTAQPKQDRFTELFNKSMRWMSEEEVNAFF